MATYGTITVTLTDWLGNSSQFKAVVPSKNATLANAKKVADFLKGKSDAAVSGYGATVGYDDSAVSGKKYDTCLQRLQFFFENGDGKPRSFGIPAPTEASVNDKQQPDSDLAEDFKDTLVAIGALSGNWKYNGGGMKSRTPKKGARDTAMTGI